MKSFLLLLHLIVTVLLMSLILLQNSKGGLSTGGGEFYRSRRGAERIVFTGTIVTAIVFLVTSVLILFVR